MDHKLYILKMAIPSSRYKVSPLIYIEPDIPNCKWL